MDLREAGGNMHLHCHNLQWKVRMIIKRIESLLTLELSEREKESGNRHKAAGERTQDGHVDVR